MLTTDAIAYYRSKAAIARELKIGKAAVSKWGSIVPRNWAAELHVRTNGKLHFDPAEYEPGNKPESSEAA